ncbi:MAG: hypothetical protein AB1813_13375 [Verrucomicrobiota bacterium]
MNDILRLFWFSLLTLQATPAILAQIETVTSPAPGLGSATGQGHSFDASFSADGRWAAFTSLASGLVAIDENNASDVFLRDLQTGSVILVSTNRFGTGSANGHSSSPLLSANGRWTLFQSHATNLTSLLPVRLPNLFLRDNVTGEISQVDRSAQNQAPFGRVSGREQFSADGNLIVFASDAPSLVSGFADANGARDVFVRDVAANKAILISKHRTANTTATGDSHLPVMTPDGTQVAFASNATNLTTGVTGQRWEVYLRQIPSAKTIWVSSNAASFKILLTTMANRLSVGNIGLSDDGRFVSYKMALGPRAIILRTELPSLQTVLVTSNALGQSVPISDPTGPVMSRDGRFLLFEAKTNGTTSSGFSAALSVIYLWDGNTKTTRLISQPADGKPWPDGPSTMPDLSANARYAAFVSTARNLVAGVETFSANVYLHDLLDGTTVLVSRAHDGSATYGNEWAAPTFSASPGILHFQSLFPSLVENDRNQALDLFAYHVASEALSLISGRDGTIEAETAQEASNLDRGAINRSGDRIVFTSTASDHVAEDENFVADVFVRDLGTRHTSIVSVKADGAGSGNSFSIQPVISLDGNAIAFASRAGDLVSGDGNNRTDIFLRDLRQATTVLASRSLNPVDGASANSSAPSISADGRRVAFQSSANNLVASDSNGKSDVFVFDAQADAVRLVSINSIGTGTGSDASSNPQISPDGRWVVFQSSAPNLVSPEVTAGFNRIYVRDLETAKTRLLNVGSAIIVGATHPREFAIATGNRFVVFTGGNRGSFFRHDLLLNVNALVHTNAAAAVISDDGRWIAIEELSASSPVQVSVIDMNSGTLLRASVNNAGASGNNASFSPSLSPNGRYVAFMSRANNLVANDTNGVTDVFLRDVVSGTTLRLSAPSSGENANQISSRPQFSVDGRVIVFQSFASNLAEKDFNGTRDLFVVRLAAGDSDNDELPDDWEMNFFGNLNETGSRDVDEDGFSNLDEFKAGTNPTNNTSLLRVITLTSATTGRVTLLWSAVPGRRYRVEFTNALDGSNWTALGEASALRLK